MFLYFTIFSDILKEMLYKLNLTCEFNPIAAKRRRDDQAC